MSAGPAWRQRLDALATRERVALLAAAVAVMVYAWHAAVWRPLQRETAAVAAGVREAEVAREALEARAQAVLARAGIDPDAASRARLEQLDGEVAAVRARIEAAARRMVPPARTAAVLRELLEASPGLEVLALEGLGAEPVLEPPADAPPEDAAMGVYRHGVRLEFAGGYLQALDYLRALEALPWALAWDRLSLEVVDYPLARTAVVVYTLSLDRRWIGASG